MPFLWSYFTWPFLLVWLWMWVSTHFNRANNRVVIRGVIKEEMETTFPQSCSSFIRLIAQGSNAVAIVSSSKFGNYILWELTSLLHELSCKESFRLLFSFPWYFEFTWNPRSLSNIASMQTWNNCIFLLTQCREHQSLLKNLKRNENQYIWTWCRTDTNGKMKPLLEVSSSNVTLC